MADGFIFYKSFSDALRDIPAEQFKKIVLAISDYALDGAMPDELDLIGNAMFTLIKPQIDANNKRREDGAKGGRPRKTSGYETEKPVVIETENHRLSDEKPKEKDKVKVKDKEKEKVEREKSPDVAVATLDAPDVIKERLQCFVEMRKKAKRPMTGHAVELMYKHLQEKAKDTETQCAMIDQSIRNGWLDIYEIKDDKKRTSPNKFNNIIEHDFDFGELEKALLAR